jgi:hypothetical protein
VRLIPPEMMAGLRLEPAVLGEAEAAEGVEHGLGE